MQIADICIHKYLSNVHKFFMLQNKLTLVLNYKIHEIRYPIIRYCFKTMDEKLHMFILLLSIIKYRYTHK